MDSRVQTDRTIHKNKSDIIICSNEEGTYILGAVAILGDRNVSKKKVEKIL